MDIWSEVELKYGATGVTAQEVQAFLDIVWPRQVFSYKRVLGRDDFYDLGQNTIRHRHDCSIGKTPHSTLTVKVRKSQESIMDRHEVDLPMEREVTPEDVGRFMALSGFKLAFSILKESFIWHVRYLDGVVAVVALYSAKRPEGSDFKWFLEVEIEKDPKVPLDFGISRLNSVAGSMKQYFMLGEPINRSLQEIYRP